ncbi:MAG: hypothetical protein KBC67_03245 [Candidatus Pacebacteria bacterium]|nr:hypothetical protein [Candidatus Paceibacterota bacterium]
MITIEDLKDPQKFSDFVERMEKGETTEEEEAIFDSYLSLMEKTVDEIKEIITNNQNN